MAIDTAVKRHSALVWGRGGLPLPDGAIAVGDRATLLGLYSGFSYIPVEDPDGATVEELEWESDEIQFEVVSVSECLIVGDATTREISPLGVGHGHIFTNIYFTLRAWTDGLLELTPIVDGEVKLDAMRTIDFGGGYINARHEVALYERVMLGGREVGRKALRGTWFRLRIRVIDELGVGRVRLGGFELEYERATLTHPDQRFVEENATFRTPPGTGRFQIFGLRDSNGLLLYRAANSDAGEAVSIFARSNPAAPHGPGAELIFTQVSIPLYRFNTEHVTLLVTPFVDDESYPALTVELEPTLVPIREVRHVDLYSPVIVGDVEVGRNAIRGTWWRMDITSTEGVPAGTIRFGRAELECEPVTESARAE